MLYEPRVFPNEKDWVEVAGVPPVDAPVLEEVTAPKRPGDPDGFVVLPPTLPNENAPAAGWEAPVVDGVLPNSPPEGLFAAGVVEKSVEDPGPEVAPPAVPNNPAPGVLLLVVALLPKMDDAPPELDPAPNRGLLGVLLPPPACEKLKAIARGCTESTERAVGAFGRWWCCFDVVNRLIAEVWSMIPTHFLQSKVPRVEVKL
jgi:hypothetical protein